jgi:hypothetical protein
MGVTPSQVDDIDELRAYVEERNNAAVSAMCQSLVVNDDVAAPSMECIWNEEVGTFRGAEVIYHEVEPLEMPESDLVKVPFIKSVAF